MRVFTNKWFSRWADDEELSDKANISNKEKTALQLTAKDFLSATDKQLQALLSTMKYREVTAHEQNS